MATNTSPSDSIAVFQDFKKPSSSSSLSAEDSSDRFFELANVTHVGYRCKNGQLVKVKQFPHVENCTGGIVWETSFLLATYLEHNRKQILGKRVCSGVVEVGAGCGMLGLVLAHLTKARVPVCLTEAEEAMEHLKENVSCCSAEIASQYPKHKALPATKMLRWGKHSDIDKVQSHFTDPPSVIVGTDVVFNQSLVFPLLESLYLLSDDNTQVFLCLQQRCFDAHQLLLKLMPQFFCKVDDLSADLSSTLGCEEAGPLDVLLFRLQGKESSIPIDPVKTSADPSDEERSIGTSNKRVASNRETGSSPADSKKQRHS